MCVDCEIVSVLNQFHDRIRRSILRRVAAIVAIERLRSDPVFYLILKIFRMLVTAVIVRYSALRQRSSYIVYRLCLLIMNLSSFYPMIRFISVIRRFLIIFPLFIQLAVWGARRVSACSFCSVIACYGSILPRHMCASLMCRSDVPLGSAASYSAGHSLTLGV